MNKKEILQCPFCDGKGKIKDMKRFTFFVECVDCKASTGMFVKKHEAIDAWNRRDGVYEK